MPYGECSGVCCERFTLSRPPNELAEWLADAEDGPQIAAMVIYLGPADDGNPINSTACANLTSEGRCAIYDNRPRMCRGFPYAARCGHCGYEERSWSGGRVPGLIWAHMIEGVESRGGGWYRTPSGNLVRGHRRLVEAFSGKLPA